jgi:hypothetical protein
MFDLPSLHLRKPVSGSYRNISLSSFCESGMIEPGEVVVLHILPNMEKW